KLISGYVVDSNAVLVDCGAITCEERTTFGNGLELPLGIESGGREVAVYAEMDTDTAAEVAKSRGQHAFLESYQRAVGDYAAQVASKRGFIGREAVIRTT